MVDSLKRGSDDHVTAAVDRNGLYRAQTPQAFNYRSIVKAHEAAVGQDFTDDVAVATAAGMDTKIIAGDEAAFKITHSEDFRKAEQHLMMQMSDIRIGQG